MNKFKRDFAIHYLLFCDKKEPAEERKQKNKKKQSLWMSTFSTESMNKRDDNFSAKTQSLRNLRT